MFLDLIVRLNCIVLSFSIPLLFCIVIEYQFIVLYCTVVCWMLLKASNPGQFDTDSEIPWNKGLTPDSVIHMVSNVHSKSQVLMRAVTCYKCDTIR